MKVLSMKQPFAELVLQGKKTIELRRWNTKFRGEFLIHSPKVPDKNAMKKFGFKELPLGCIVGKAELIEVKKYIHEKEHEADRNKHLASSYWGNYGFVLKNSERIKEIICSGKLGFWDFNSKI